MSLRLSCSIPFEVPIEYGNGFKNILTFNSIETDRDDPSYNTYNFHSHVILKSRYKLNEASKNTTIECIEHWISFMQRFTFPKHGNFKEPRDYVGNFILNICNKNYTFEGVYPVKCEHYKEYDHVMDDWHIFETKLSVGMWGPKYG